MQNSISNTTDSSSTSLGQIEPFSLRWLSLAGQVRSHPEENGGAYSTYGNAQVQRSQVGIRSFKLSSKFFPHVVDTTRAALKYTCFII